MEGWKDGRVEGGRIGVEGWKIGGMEGAEDRSTAKGVRICGGRLRVPVRRVHFQYDAGRRSARRGALMTHELVTEVDANDLGSSVRISPHRLHLGKGPLTVSLQTLPELYGTTRASLGEPLVGSGRRRTACFYEWGLNS